MASESVRNRHKPEWLKIRLNTNANYSAIRNLVQHGALHTVCEDARCPNQNECWGRRTATFMILGNTCTRNCRFCAVATGKPQLPDRSEPQKVAEAIRIMGLKYAVVTSVTRDDLPDGGAEHWAATIRAIREINPECQIEVLIPDFRSNLEALQMVWTARPNVVGHNLETVKELYQRVRPQANYQRSLQVLKRTKEAGFITKTGIMVGLGETRQQITGLMRDAAAVGCDILTIGQYLQPTPGHLPVEQFVSPEEYAEYQQLGLQIGLRAVYAGPLVRSSYHAEEITRLNCKNNSDAAS